MILYIFLTATCENPSPENGQINPLGHNGVYHENNTVSFTCNYGYRINGTNSSICQADGTWEPYPATCIPGNYTMKTLILFRFILS